MSLSTILQHGSQLHCYNYYYNEALYSRANEYTPLAHKDDQEDLVQACRQGNLQLIQRLFAAPDWVDDDVDVPKLRLALHWACWEGHVEIVELLLDHLPVNRTLLHDQQDGGSPQHRGLTPLLTASFQNHVEGGWSCSWIGAPTLWAGQHQHKKLPPPPPRHFIWPASRRISKSRTCCSNAVPICMPSTRMGTGHSIWHPFTVTRNSPACSCVAGPR